MAPMKLILMHIVAPEYAPNFDHIQTYSVLSDILFYKFSALINFMEFNVTLFQVEINPKTDTELKGTLADESWLQAPPGIRNQRSP